ncbi:hypothetical protein DFH27DRAFT_540750 [Peziza echinospora]|nr:hypothetical protein DFH27DRAFT_540750 [Peziza echinospora]
MSRASNLIVPWTLFILDTTRARQHNCHHFASATSTIPPRTSSAQTVRLILSLAKFTRLFDDQCNVCCSFPPSKLVSSSES